MELVQSNKSIFNQGYFQCADNLANYINSLDTEGMTVKDLRSAIYKWAVLAEPNYGEFPTEG